MVFGYDGILGGLGPLGLLGSFGPDGSPGVYSSGGNTWSYEGDGSDLGESIGRYGNFGRRGRWGI